MEFKLHTILINW